VPAPSATALKDEFTAHLDAGFFNPNLTAEQDEWLSALTEAMSSAWADWQGSIVGSGLTVTGSGLGTWTGTGSGGGLTEGTPMKWDSSPAFGLSPELTTLDDSLSAHVKDRFTTWVGTYTFTSTSWVGTTTATQNSSGTFDATVIDIALSDAGSGDNPQSVKDDVLADLNGAGWDPGATDPNGNRVALIIEWLEAFDGMLENKFEDWLQGTQYTANTCQGPSSAGDGSGTGTSNQDGLLS
jgi:hypothetical protein